MDNIEFQARSFVNGLVEETKHGEITGRRVVASGEWAQRFRDLNLVRQAEDEGWGNELRAAVVRTVKGLLAAGRPVPAVADLMPTDVKWIEAQRAQAHRFSLAKEWRDSVMAPGEKFDDYLRRQRPGIRRGDTFKPVSALAFHAMQEASRNRHLHADAKAELERIKRGDLTERSRRMQGDDE